MVTLLNLEREIDVLEVASFGSGLRLSAAEIRQVTPLELCNWLVPPLCSRRDAGLCYYKHVHSIAWGRAVPRASLMT